MPFKLTPRKSDATIAAEWDALSLKRFNQIISGLDLTYNHILVPEVLRLLGPARFAKILDVGCGTGILTSFLAEKGEFITGIDLSQKNIDIAKSINPLTTQLFCASINEFSIGQGAQFDAVVANMVLMDTTNLDQFIFSLSNITADGGLLVFCITHPMFWPSYSGYEREAWFKYDEQITIEAPFRTSLDPDGDLVSTHVHRPLNIYFNCLRKYGFIFDAISEPMPSDDLQNKYPSRWKFPRYFFARCIKLPNIIS